MTRINPDAEFSKAALDAERWWTENGYTYKLTKRYLHKDVYTVSKNGVMVQFEIPDTVTDSKGNMDFFKKLFELEGRV